MQNKRTYIIFGVALVVVALAAFIGGRLLTGQAGPLSFFPMRGGGFTMSIGFTRAPELPTTEPDAQGSFVERNDNTIVVQAVSMDMGKGGVVIVGEGGGGPTTSNGPGGGAGPKVDVVITNETIIYRDATEPPPPSELDEETTIQQVVEPGTLDDITSDTMIMVWGRESGGRIIADVIVYSRPVMFKRPGP